MMQPPKNKITDTIINKRWPMLVAHATVMIIAVVAGFSQFITGHYISFGVNCFLFGWSAALFINTIVAPGILKDFGEINGAVMRAQFEKHMNEAIAEIKRQNPEISDINITRMQ